MKNHTETDRPESEWQRFHKAGSHRCPKCRSLIYSRKSVACGICGLRLPESLRLQGWERIRSAEMLAAERLRHKEWLTRREVPSYCRLNLA